MEGLTGHIAFDENGFRKDYRFDVNELTVDSHVRKVGMRVIVLSSCARLMRLDLDVRARRRQPAVHCARPVAFPSSTDEQTSLGMKIPKILRFIRYINVAF
jgi:hypothetical protein